jgi:hypothetical protein
MLYIIGSNELHYLLLGGFITSVGVVMAHYTGFAGMLHITYIHTCYIHYIAHIYHGHTYTHAQHPYTPNTNKHTQVSSSTDT